MFFKIISKEVKLKGVNELVYEISYNDARNFYMKKSTYDKFNSGEVHFSCDTRGYRFTDKDGNELKKECGVY